MEKKTLIKNSFKAAFPHTLPIMAGYVFLGFAYGIYMHSLGFNFLYPTIMAIVIYGGSLEFVAAASLVSDFAPAQMFIVAFLIQSRHIFYGLTMLDKYKGLGIKKYYLIFGLTDETFAVNSSVNVPENADKGWFYVFVTMLDKSYWVTGAFLGGLTGAVLPFDLTGLDFVMTAMFVVIFLDKWLADKKHYSALIGVISTTLCLIIFGANSFMIPSMVLITSLLCAFEKKITKEADNI